MNKDQIIGSTKQVIGDLQARLGRATRSTRQRARGLELKLEGRAQSSYGDALEAVEDVEDVEVVDNSGSDSRRPAGGT